MFMLLQQPFKAWETMVEGQSSASPFSLFHSKKCVLSLVFPFFLLPGEVVYSQPIPSAIEHLTGEGSYSKMLINL